MRNTFVESLIKIAQEDERVFLIAPDVGFSVLEVFKAKFPDRFLNVGIAESNAVNIASGLALSGKIAYVYSMVPFVTMRPFEQIRINLAYMNTKVRLIGVGAGLSYGVAGATHHSIEDISIMRSLPNMTVLSPYSLHEVEQLIQASVDVDGPVYIRLGQNKSLSTKDKSIEIGYLNYLFREKDSNIALIFTGNSYDVALEVFNALGERGLGVNLISAHSLKPFDYEGLDTVLKTNKYIFTVEEHSVIGGLGSIIAESNFTPYFKRFGLPDKYSHFVGAPDYIRSMLGFTADNIVRSVMCMLENRT